MGAGGEELNEPIKLGGKVSRKRFTDTEKWFDPWFRSMPPKMKCVWQYILDTCDNVGVWKLDLVGLSFNVGETVFEEEFAKYFDGRLLKISDEKYWVRKFVSFQYGELTMASAPHRAYIKLAQQHGILEDIQETILEKSGTPSAIRKRITNNLRDEIFLRDEFTCLYCKRQFTKKELVVDHFKPIKKDGNNENENLVTSCVSCNSHKSDFTFEEYSSRIGMLPERITEINEYMRGLERVSNSFDTLIETPKDKKKTRKGQEKESAEELL